VLLAHDPFGSSPNLLIIDGLVSVLFVGMAGIAAGSMFVEGVWKRTVHATARPSEAEQVSKLLADSRKCLGQTCVQIRIQVGGKMGYYDASVALASTR